MVDGQLAGLIERAALALGRLDSVSQLLPGTGLFIYAYVRKEAVLSSQIEGTKSTFSDLLLFEAAEAPGAPIDDVEVVSNYVAAMEYGLEALKRGMPVSGRLLREMHAILLRSGRGSSEDPGEFRRSQNWVNGTRPGDAEYVPPPPERVLECIGELDKFVNDQPETTPTLLKAALAHVQFETIHPFLDGNGRLGRMLVTLLLCAHDVLHQPLLYLSLYLKVHRGRYFELLQKVRREGAWTEWVAFFMQGLIETAEGAVATAGRLTQLFERDAQALRTANAPGSMHRVLGELQVHPIRSIQQLSVATGLSQPAVTTALKRLGGMGMVAELTKKKRNRLFGYSEYLSVLNEGTIAT